MKKYILLYTIALLNVMSVFGQATKPKLMIVPAEKWMVAHNYVDIVEKADGTTKKVPNYYKAFTTDQDLSKFIGAMEAFMTEQNYEVVNLESAVADMDKQDAITDMDTDADAQLDPLDALLGAVECDITVKLNYEIKKDGGEKFIEMEVGAYDAYNNKPVSTGHIGSGTPAAGSLQWTNQIKEGVSNFKDQFISNIDQYFQRLFENGRQIIIRCNRSESATATYSKLYDDESLATLIEDFITDNALKGNGNIDGAVTKNKANFRAQIPMTYTDKKGRTKAADAYWFGRKIASFITDTTGEPCKVLPLGLGAVRITLGAE